MTVESKLVINPHDFLAVLFLVLFLFLLPLVLSD